MSSSTTITVKLDPTDYSLLKRAVDEYATTCKERAKVGGGSDKEHWTREQRSAHSLGQRL